MYIDFLSKLGVGGAHPGGFQLTKELLSMEKINRSSYILDVGCGTGQTAAYLAAHYGAKVIGIDINPIMVEKARLRMKQYKLPVDIIQGSIEDCPFENNQFDFILCESVLAFANAPKSLKEIFRVVKSGGRFIANELTINHSLDETSKKEIKQFYGLNNILMEQDWITLLGQSGFQNIKIHMQKSPLYHSMTEFPFSDYVETELLMIMIQHFNIMAKYHGILDNRIFSCTK
ncbi:class I SAM-dependent methyltransferase [Bacillus sp. FJAT-50079]|nr:class I SAM-dependent methyltransferase [Bacillus sp. FJAT-50079]MBS4209476.1 class I SAM-dependent methyltransferase [Bacillus sp. FJAT-50079]